MKYSKKTKKAPRFQPEKPVHLHKPVSANLTKTKKTLLESFGTMCYVLLLSGTWLEGFIRLGKAPFLDALAGTSQLWYSNGS